MTNGPNIKVGIQTPRQPTVSGGIVTAKGPKGDQGDPGVVVSPTPPTNLSLIWLDTS